MNGRRTCMLIVSAALASSGACTHISHPAIQRSVVTHRRLAACSHADAAVRWKPSDGAAKTYYSNLALTMENRHGFPVWFVCALWGNQDLPANGAYLLGNWNRKPIEANAYNDGHGRAVLVAYYGDDGFNAFLLPPHGRVVFENYVIEANQPIRRYSIHEAKSLRVNGVTPLEQWLPYDVRSDREVMISSGLRSGNWKSLDFELDNPGGGRPYPTEAVRYVNADLLGCSTFAVPAR